MNKIDALRNCLIKNKIFFEIFSLLLVGAVSVYLSFAANKYLEIQTKIIQQDHLPTFRIENYLVSKNNNLFEATEFLNIFNDGYRVNVHYFKQYCFLELIVNFGEYSKSKKYRITIPIDNYFSTTKYIDSKEKIVEGKSLIPVNDFLKAEEQNRNDLIENGTSQDMWIEAMFLKKYISLNYSDHLGKKTTLFYELPGNLVVDNRKPEIISQEKAKEITELHNLITTKGISFKIDDSFTYADIKKKLYKISNEQQLTNRFKGRS